LKVILRKPGWVNKKIDFSKTDKIQKLFNKLKISTVCNEARCPNISECFLKGTATFLILGDICTRQCRFCNVKKGKPARVDIFESEKIVEAVKILNLKYVVITSVTRDDLDDGGAFLFADCIKKIRDFNPEIKVEVLVPDFKGKSDSLLKVINAKPDVFGHNIETVPELYYIRKGASYDLSLSVIAFAKQHNLITKSSIMLGLGEKEDQVIRVFMDLKNNGCDFLSIGQYLQPDSNLMPVKEYLKPEKFEFYEKKAKEIGFLYVKSGIYVRSSYLAEEYFYKSQKE